jgi:hypothetical protein
MAGTCWRLLAIFSLIFVAPSLLLGQDGAAERFPGKSSVAAPTMPLSGYPPPIAPVWIPPPSLPRPYPIVPSIVGLQQNVFQQLVRSAGIIFSGRVTFVGHGTSSSSPSHTSTTIAFQIEHAMRGASPGQNLTIHEWAGLWERGERYRVGERVLLFLYAPSKLGLTSPVAGAMGRFALDSQDKIVMSPQHIETFVADTILGGKAVVPYADFALAVRRFQPQRMSQP